MATNGLLFGKKFALHSSQSGVQMVGENVGK